MNANITRPLYEGASLRLAAPDREHDAEIEAGWSNDHMGILRDEWARRQLDQAAVASTLVDLPGKERVP